MNKDIYSRIIGLIGEESFSNVTNKKIYLAGLVLPVKKLKKLSGEDMAMGNDSAEEQV